MEVIILGNPFLEDSGTVTPIVVPAYEAEEAVIELTTGYDPYVIAGSGSDLYWVRSATNTLRPILTTDKIVIGGTSFLGSEVLRVVGGINSTLFRFGSESTYVDTIKDEDDLASDDEHALATQQSIKAYIDNVAVGIQPGDNISLLTNDVPYLTAETDPIFVASDVYSVTTSDITNWNTAYGWGDHSLAGYLTVETDPVFVAHVAYTITSTDISNWNEAYSQEHVHSNFSLLESIVSDGDGTHAFFDDGTYKTVPTSIGGSDTNVQYNDGGVLGGDSTFYFNDTTKRVYTTYITTTQLDLNSTESTTYITEDVGGNLEFTDAVSGTVTLATLLGGATNYWSTTTGGIYYSTGSDKVGIGTSTLGSEILTVNGNIEADDFNSSYFRYSNSNLLLGPNAGDNETGDNRLYIANTDTTTPLIYGDFVNQEIILNADTYINVVKRLAFGNSTVYIRGDNFGNLILGDTQANAGDPIYLSDIIIGDPDDFSMVADYVSYASVTSISAANLVTWGKAAYIVTTGAGDAFLSNDGTYKIVGASGSYTSLFLHSESSDISTYEKLLTSYTNDTETTSTAAVTSGTSPLLMDEWVTELGYPGVSSIPAGLWRFKTWLKVDDNSGTTTVTINVYNRTTAITAFTATPVAGGTGYLPGEVLDVAGGTGGTATVSTIAATGGVNTVSIVAGGTGYTPGTNSLTIVAGNNDAVISCTADGGGVIVSIDSITTKGTGYSVASPLATTGGGNNDCTVNVTVINGAVTAFNTVPTSGGTSYTTGTKATSGSVAGADATIDVASVGVETELFNVTTEEINNTTPVQFIVESVQSSFSIDDTDRLVVKYYANTTNATTINVDMYYEGSTRYTYLIAPLISESSMTVVDYTWKWDTTNFYYRPYTDKTEAGGALSAGKFFNGTDAVSATNRLNYDGNLYSTNLSASTLTSSIAVGTAPLTITSTTKVSNLNVDLLDDEEGSYYLDYSNFTNLPTFTAGSVLFSGGSSTISEDNAAFFWDDSNNRLGLGTATPAKSLHIYGSSGDTTVRITDIYAAGFGAIDFYNNSGAAGLIVQYGSTGSGYGGASSFNIINSANASLTLGTNGTVRVTILGSGNVGIFNTNPGELLTLGTAGATAGVLSLAGATSGKATIVVSAVAGTPTLTLPTSTGTLALTSDIVTPADSILDWTGTAYSPYAAQTSGCFDTSVTTPVHTTVLNYDGYFYATRMYTSGVLVNSSGANSTGLYSAIASTSGNNYGLNAKAYGSSADQNTGAIIGATGATTNYALYIPVDYPTAGANNWSLYNNSVAKSYFAGSIGVGTNDPSVKLDILGIVDTDILYVSTSNGIRFRVGVNSDDTGYLTLYDSSDNADVHLNTQDDSTSWIVSNFGVGTTSPVTKLHVFGGPTRLEYSATNGQQYGFIHSIDSFHVSENAYFDGTWKSIEGSHTAVVFQTNAAGSEAFRIAVDTSVSGADETLTMNPLFVVKTDGKVGISTTSPTSELHIVGQAYATHGRKPAGTIHGTSVTDDTIFDALSPAIPNTNDTMVIHGSIDIGVPDQYYPLLICSYALRYSSTIITFYGLGFDLYDNSIYPWSTSVTNGSSSTCSSISISW